ncbi:hypothetical protein K402DRAFT_392267 [Aulographum hederae CBS 113979]|uniref:Uncharacterized protein n=1 Tax=Aulographum hederae CBS 113979 TaxID=1176131 RepID=A0A6G1H4J0_9PEZI|nr:hypothetical protein K402DRAFT_392267 [Aulographum hederae CBS 113979]
MKARENGDNEDRTLSIAPSTAIVATGNDDPATENIPPSRARSTTSSIHLWNMRISQHLRSPSAISYQSTVDARSVMQLSPAVSRFSSRVQSQLGRHQHRVSKSGFEVSQAAEEEESPNTRDAASSCYSSPRHSPSVTPKASALSIVHCSERLRVSQYDSSAGSTGTVLQVSNCKSNEQNEESNNFSERNTHGGGDSQTDDAGNSRLREETSPGTGASEEPIFKDNRLFLGSQVFVLKAPSITSTEGRLRRKLSSKSVSMKIRRPFRRSSVFNFFAHRQRTRPGRFSDGMPVYDGTADIRRRKVRSASSVVLGDGRDQAARLFSKAAEARDEERSAFFLDPNKAKDAPYAPRERSQSFSRPILPSGGSHKSMASASSAPQARRVSFAPPTFSSVNFLSPESAYERPRDIDRSPTSLDPLDAGTIRKSSIAHSPALLNPLNTVGEPPSFLLDSAQGPSASPLPSIRNVHLNDEGEVSPTQGRTRAPSFSFNVSSAPASPALGPDSPESSTLDLDLDLGAWGRYPSHTRALRTGSAGTADRVHVRDFAYDDLSHSRSRQDTTEETASNDSASSKEKGRPKFQYMLKSRSMTFGRNFLKNYAKLFKSQSQEFLRHGHGHRTSIAAGGELSHPELELLPPIFTETQTGYDGEFGDLGLSRSPARGHDESTVVAPPSPSPAPKPLVEFGTVSRFDGTDDDVGYELLRQENNTLDTTSRVPTTSMSSPSALEAIGRTDPPTIHPQPESAHAWSQIYTSLFDNRPRFSLDDAGSSTRSNAGPGPLPGHILKAILERAQNAESLGSSGEEAPMPKDTFVKDFLASVRMKRSPVSGKASSDEEDKENRYDDSRVGKTGEMADELECPSGRSGNAEEGAWDLEAAGWEDGVGKRSKESLRASTVDMMKVIREAEMRDRERCLGFGVDGTADGDGVAGSFSIVDVSVDGGVAV